MYRKFAVALLSLCLIVSFAGSAFSQAAPKPAPAAPASSPAHGQAPGSAPAPVPAGKQLVGDIVKVDAKAKRITLKTEAGEKQVDVSSAALGGYKSLADIKAGDKVALLYEEKGGKMVAKVIMNHGAMMKGGPAPAPAKTK